MPKKCKDPICPANRHAPVSDPQKGKSRKSKTVSTIGAVGRRQNATGLDTDVKICKNKKCQAATVTVECSTSMSPTRKICVRSLASNKFSKWKRKKCQDIKTICHCNTHEKMATHISQRPKKMRNKKRSRRRGSNQKNKFMSTLCICVRNSDSDS
nr:uncharacterized protein LOC117219866 [Megalopta genalis]